MIGDHRLLVFLAPVFPSTLRFRPVKEGVKNHPGALSSKGKRPTKRITNEGKQKSCQLISEGHNRYCSMPNLQLRIRS
ncbi:unnamed protein product [Lactuca virosa]|uniref:Uncharacterized protein n=1 Tax=Lactuca virosa TaxID=75947 RepID=A0AAU9NVA2_9ASTR|nr:unnamed protein product [Lactuca virosa]